MTENKLIRLRQSKFKAIERAKGLFLQSHSNAMFLFLCQHDIYVDLYYVLNANAEA